jgi:hypothetical protein
MFPKPNELCVLGDFSSHQNTQTGVEISEFMHMQACVHTCGISFSVRSEEVETKDRVEYEMQY